MAPILYVRDLSIPLSVKPSTVVHEAAHAYHLMKDTEISIPWARAFPNVRDGRKRDDPEFVRDSGIVNPYAALNINEEPVRVKYPSKDLRGTYTLWGTKIEVYDYDSEQHADRVEELIGQVANLPGQLADAVAHVVIYPALNVHGCMKPNTGVEGKPDELWYAITEDIATSTAAFHAVFTQPDSYKCLQRRIDTNPKTRHRVEMLVEYGFLDFDIGATLLKDRVIRK